MKAVVIAAALFLFVFSAAAFAQEQQERIPEGYIREQSTAYTSIYNPEHMQQMFGERPAPQTAGEAYQRLQEAGDGLVTAYYSDGILGYFYGTIVADVLNRKIAITNGGFISPAKEQAGEAQEEEAEGETMTFGALQVKYSINLTGERIEADALALPNMRLMTNKGIYAEEAAVIVCETGCRLSVRLSPEDAYMNVSGRAMVIRSDYLDEHLGRVFVPLPYYAEIENINSIRIHKDAEISLEGISRAPFSLFSNFNFSSSDVVDIGRIMSEAHRGRFYNAFLPAADAKVVILQNNDLLSVAPESGKISFEIMPEQLYGPLPALSGKLGVVLEKAKEASKGKFFLNDMVGFEACDKASFACLYQAQGITKIKPTAGAGNEIRLVLSYPRTGVLQPLEKLEIDAFGEDESSITVERAGVNARLIFTRGDVKVENGNWFDPGVSFSAYVYDASLNLFNYLECDAVLKECTLDRQKVSGLTRQALKKSCANDADCGEHMACIQQMCVRKAECQRMTYLNPAGGTEAPINILFISDRYPEREDFVNDIEHSVNGMTSTGGRQRIGLLTAEPFSNYRSRFAFTTLYTGASPLPMGFEGIEAELIPSERYVNRLAKQCPRANKIVVLSNMDFRPFASGHNLFISTAFYGNEWAGSSVVHEIGHTFGINDEYYEPEIQPCSYNGPTCKSETQARADWGNALADRAIAEGWKGCGVCCGDCLRPALNSIMNDHTNTETGGGRFSPPAVQWIQEVLEGKHAP